MEQYTWVLRQIGQRGAWQPYQLAGLPCPPTIDDKVTIQRWASAECGLNESHKAALVLDFDAHADWLTLEHCLAEVRHFVQSFSARWQIAPAALQIAFSGRAGVHITIPAALLGDPASPHLTGAYKRWATQIKDTLGLITLDAPSRQPPEWWWERIGGALGALPPAVRDRAAFALALRRVGIYTRRRMLRREGSRHPGSGLYKVPLFPHELSLSAPAIRALAAQPRERAATVAPSPHAALAEYLALLLAEEHAAAARRPSVARADGAWDDLAGEQPEEAPRCVQRLLALPPPEGGSNLPLINLLAYWRQIGLSETDAVGRAAAWLLRGVDDPQRRADRLASASSVGRAVYAHRYAFARHYIEPLQVVSAAECAECPLRERCASSHTAVYTAPAPEKGGERRRLAALGDR